MIIPCTHSDVSSPRHPLLSSFSLSPVSFSLGMHHFYVATHFVPPPPCLPTCLLFCTMPPVCSLPAICDCLPCSCCCLPCLPPPPAHTYMQSTCASSAATRTRPHCRGGTPTLLLRACLLPALQITCLPSSLYFLLPRDSAILHLAPVALFATAPPRALYLGFCRFSRRMTRLQTRVVPLPAVSAAEQRHTCRFPVLPYTFWLPGALLNLRVLPFCATRTMDGCQHSVYTVRYYAGLLLCYLFSFMWFGLLLRMFCIAASSAIDNVTCATRRFLCCSPALHCRLCVTPTNAHHRRNLQPRRLCPPVYCCRVRAP